MRIKKLIILASILVLFTMCAPSRPAVVYQPEPPPMWGPVGYDQVRYYYFPDMMVYYDVHSSMFIYPRGNRWVSAYYLPNHYGHFDLYNSYKVGLMDYYGPSPYNNFNMHMQQYAVGNQWPYQQTLGVRGQNQTHYAPTRPRTSSAQGTRGTRAQQADVRGNTSPSSIRNTTGTRSSTTPAVRNPTNTNTPRAIPTTPRANPSTPRVAPAETRSSTRLPQPDARAVRERTQQIRQQNRATAPTQRSTGTTTPTTTRDGGGRGN
ncbi:hypothetical protein [Flavobacterium orientale]|uniref:Lipoprotein n=1 Tax=Flavobacterium orientale TaxID=1756020 RepID=A0A916XYA4_9FLAO|nr:hypothetical protein [Flavobacterium orientale]GGD20592.1 hypothetical protein GCM10011343_08890 [Flavobacterium orientale]